MKVSELIEKLKEMPQDYEINIWESDLSEQNDFHIGRDDTLKEVILSCNELDDEDCEENE